MTRIAGRIFGFFWLAFWLNAVFLNPGGLTIGAVLVAVCAFLLYAQRQAFLTWLKAEAVS